jgi:hypothetical protein
VFVTDGEWSPEVIEAVHRVVGSGQRRAENLLMLWGESSHGQVVTAAKRAPQDTAFELLRADPITGHKKVRNANLGGAKGGAARPSFVRLAEPGQARWASWIAWLASSVRHTYDFFDQN